MLCDICLVNSMCKIGCDKLLEVLNIELLEDEKIVKRIFSSDLQRTIEKENEKVIINSSSITWCKNGNVHREDGPAIEHVNGTTIWYKNGKIHRDNGPAVEHTSGYKIWYKNGKYNKETL